MPSHSSIIIKTFHCFTLINNIFLQARSNALVVINLSAFKDFKVNFSTDQEGTEHNGFFHVNVFGQQTVDAVLQFVPSEVCYDRCNLTILYFIVKGILP